MTRMMWGIAAPLVFTATTLLLVFKLNFQPSMKWGISTGIVLALLQSFLSVGTMRWAMRKPFFYWVWGGGIFFRMLVFAATALVIHRFTSLNLTATLLSMVTATTLFLVVESVTFMGQKK